MHTRRKTHAYGEIHEERISRGAEAEGFESEAARIPLEMKRQPALNTGSPRGRISPVVVAASWEMEPGGQTWRQERSEPSRSPRKGVQGKRGVYV